MEWVVMINETFILNLSMWVFFTEKTGFKTLMMYYKRVLLFSLKYIL